MPPRRNAKRVAEVNDSEESKQEFDASYVEEELADLQAQGTSSVIVAAHLIRRALKSMNCPPLVDARCVMIQSAAREMQDKLRLVLKTSLMRVPKKIKKMELGDFVKEHGALGGATASVAGVDENGVPQTALKGASGN